MKWVPEVEKVNRKVFKVLGVRGFYVLLAILALFLLGGAFDKWAG
jgi:hypothetical protein